MPKGPRILILCPFNWTDPERNNAEDSTEDSLLFSLTASEESQTQINILWLTTDTQEIKGQTQYSNLVRQAKKWDA